MKLLPNKELTYEQLDIIEEDGLYNYGGEATVCKTDKPNTLYKIFTSADMCTNKLRKLELLYKMQLPFSTIPLSTLSVNGRLIGYEQTFNPSDMTMFDACLTTEQKIYFLKKAKEALEFFSTKDITYGDVKSDNILVDPSTGEIRFCDMDNIRIGAYPIDIYPYELDLFFENNGAMPNVDPFMHNLLTLEQLHYEGESQFKILKMLRNGTIPHEEEQAKRIIESMIEPNKFTGEYVIQYIKR